MTKSLRPQGQMASSHVSNQRAGAVQEAVASFAWAPNDHCPNQPDASKETALTMTIHWTPEAIRALGATTDLPTLGEIFGLSTWRSREMAKTGEWEQAGIRVLKIGSRYRVTVPSILDVLGIPADDETSGDDIDDVQGDATAQAAQTDGTAGRCRRSLSTPAGTRSGH